VEIKGIGLKENAQPGDIELEQAVLGSANPTIVIISHEIVCKIAVFQHTSDKPGVKVRMRDSVNQWTAYADVTLYCCRSMQSGEGKPKSAYRHFSIMVHD
jgi:hypothetical protein